MWISCQPSLVRLMSRCAGVDWVVDGPHDPSRFSGPRPTDERAGDPGQRHWPHSPRDPYLSADAATIDHWRPVLARALGVNDLDSVFKIGIAWQGSPENRHRPLAIVSARPVCPTRRDAGSSPDQLAERERAPSNWRRWPDDFRSRSSTTTSRSRRRARLSGHGGRDESARPGRDARDGGRPPGRRPGSANLGRPLPRRRLALDGQRRDDCPWYPTARLFRQTTLGDWDGVFRRMAEALRVEISPKNDGPDQA